MSQILRQIHNNLGGSKSFFQEAFFFLQIYCEILSSSKSTLLYISKQIIHTKPGSKWMSWGINAAIVSDAKRIVFYLGNKSNT